MILVFPDADTFRLALTGGFVPPDVARSPASVSTDGAGRVAVETAAKLPKKAGDELKRLGVAAARRHVAEATPVTCWPQAVPVEKLAAEPQLSAQAAVLFDLPLAGEFPAFVGEMLRLGNDRQSFRGVGGDDGRVLLRVVGPPYYTVLRALDPAGGVQAFVEQAPRVWVAVGYAHPLADRIEPADGQIVLVRPPRDWRFLADAPFTDVYDNLRFGLPAAPAAWRDAPLGAKITVPLKLAAGNATDAPELWVLRGPAADGLDSFVRAADDRVLQRLRFAVGTDAAGGRVVVLRVAASKLAPPVLAFADAVGYKPFWKIPNLYVPAGTRLHPQLRRDVVRKLLADDADQLVWLAPGPDGAFTPETLAEDAFRPLDEWVEYVIEADHAAIAAWVDASRFAFDGFVCSENVTPRAKPDKEPPRPRPAQLQPDDARPPAGGAVRPPSDTAEPTPAADEPAVPAVVKPPSEWLLRRQELEDRFLAVDGPLDAPERRRLWPELAAANAGYGDATEAGVCWLNAAWAEPAPPAAWLDAWLRSEVPDLPRPIPAAAFDARMRPAEPTPGEARQFAAVFLAVAHQPKPPAWLGERLPAVQRYLTAHESKLPVRAAWLAAFRLAQLSGADVLGLARARDRLLQRLLEEGLNVERNLPQFLRFAGSADTARARLVREKAGVLHGLVRAWAEAGVKSPSSLSGSDNGMTAGYVDLLFAFAQAKLGEATAAGVLVESARGALTAEPPAEARAITGRFLFDAYRYRIDQALAGQPHAGRLPPAMSDELDRIQAQGKVGFNSPEGFAYYAISRMQHESRVLEPLEKIDPYTAQKRNPADPFQSALADLPKERDPRALERKLRELLKGGPGGKPAGDARFQVLALGIPLAGRAGGAVSLELLGLVSAAAREPPPGGAGSPDAKDLGRFLERSLFVAGHFDHRDVVTQLVDQFVQVVAARPADSRYELMSLVAPECLRSLRRLGLRDDADRLLGRLQALVLGGRTVAELRDQHRASPRTWGPALQTLLTLAGAWAGFGAPQSAEPALAAARTDLLAPEWMLRKPADAAPNKLDVIGYTRLAAAYIAAAAQLPPADGLDRVGELFRGLKPEWVTNALTTSSCYSRLHLSLAEEVVLALTNDDAGLGADGRRWLEEDEYLIRRRVHQDMKRDLGRT